MRVGLAGSAVDGDGAGEIYALDDIRHCRAYSMSILVRWPYRGGESLTQA